MTNPIIQRELIGLLRTRKAVAAQAAVVVALALLVLLRWPSDARADYNGSQAQQVVELFGYGMLVALVLLAPVFPATSVVRERQQGTLALLLNSPMSPWSILTGKLVGQLGFVALLLALSLPAAAACYAMGGVGLDQLLRIYVVLACVAVQYAALGLLVSSYAGSVDAALRLTYGAVLALAVATLGPYQFIQGMAGMPPAVTAAADWCRRLSPVPAMMQTLGHEGVTSMGMMTTEGLTAPYALTAGLTTILMLLLIARRFNQKMLDRPRAAGIVTDERSASVRVYRRLMYLWFFDPQRRSGMIGPWTNPVMVKEFRCRRFGRANWIMRLFSACLILAMGLMLLTSLSAKSWDASAIGAIMVLLQCALIILITPSLASGLISGERESGGWQLMQMTPLTAGRIIRGKLLSVVWTLMLVLLATLPGYLVILKIDDNLLPQVVTALVSLLALAALAVLLSAAMSSIFPRTAQATATAYTILILLCAGTMLFWLGRDNPFPHALVERVLMVNPVAGALRIIEAPGFTEYRLIPGNWWFMGGACAACLLVLGVRTWQLTRPR